MGEKEVASSRVVVADWRRGTVVAAIMLAAFIFNTTENLPIGLLSLIAADLRVPLPAVGYLVSGYGITVAVASLPLAYLVRHRPRRHVLCVVLAVLLVSNLFSALTASYDVLLVSRIGAALAQAVFWAVMAPAAVAMFSTSVRGRVMGVLSIGGSLASVLGVPAANWLGTHVDWQTPFAVVSGLALVALTAVGTLLPTTRPTDGHAGYGTQPDLGRLLVVLTVTMLSVTGAFSGFTYVVEFLRSVGGFSADGVAVLLAVFGAGGLVGALSIAPLLDRYPTATLLVPVALQATALACLWGLGQHQTLTMGAIGLFGLATAPIFMSTQSWALRVAPGRTEIALAANSALFNVGVALGALLGGLVLATVDIRTTFLAGALLTLAAMAVLGTSVRGWPAHQPRVQRARTM